MTALISLYTRTVSALETSLAPVLIPSLARLVFAGTLLIYFWNAGLTKLGEGLRGLFVLDFGAYTQILPRIFDNVGYDPSQISLFWRLVALAGTWAEFILPLLLVIGLATRLAALGMIGFVLVQSWVDIVGHGVAMGAWFDNAADALIVDQRAFWLFLLIVLVLRGAGPVSVDALLARRQSSADFDAASQPR